ncbi:MAG: TolC family protein [Cyanobacteriota bacterium]|nr:TolC family protein [Cyanobacteriota bacterium]
MAKAARWATGSIGIIAVLAFSPKFEAQAQSQGWESAPVLPGDMRKILSSISKDSNLYLIYQSYRDNRDGLQKAAERITLEEAIKRGVSTSPELAETVAKIQESEFSGVAINREWVPSLSFKTSSPGVLGFSTTSTVETTDTRGDGKSSQQTFTFAHGFKSNPYADLSWAFFDPTRSTRQSAQGARIDSLRNRLTFNTRKVIYQIQAAYTNLQEALEREKDLIELFNQAIAIYIDAKEAKRPEGEVSRLEAQTVSLLLARIKAHKESIQAANTLAKLINLQPGKLALPSEKPDLIPIWPLSRLNSIEEALQRREELRANALEVEALMSDARAIRLKVFPTLALSGQIQRNNVSENGGTFNDKTKDKLKSVSGYTTFAGLTFDWKLFDGGIRNAEADAKEAKSQQTLAQGQQIRLNITKEVADAYAAFVASKIQVNAARADVSASRRSLQAALADYAAGRHDDAGTTVVQALSKLQSALDTYRNLVADQNISIYQLYRSTSSWPEQTEALVKAQYQRWLAPTAPTAAPPASALPPSQALPPAQTLPSEAQPKTP